MAVTRARSDVEIFARTRVLIASVAIYLLTVGFMALGDRLYGGTGHLLYSRLAALPFFLLLALRWVRLVRVRPPEALREARQLIARGRLRAARDKLAGIVLGSGGNSVDPRRIDRARRILQDGLAVPIADEITLEIGRCSLELGELERAVDELGRAFARLPARADVGIDLAEALSRAGQSDRAAEVLLACLPYMDATDRQTLLEQPALLRLLGERELPRRSVFWRKIALERAVLALLVLVAAVHGMHLYLGLF